MSRYILACDDEAYITRSISLKLSKAGYEVRTAADGREALEAIQSETPALLITDCQMPRMGGLELCRQLRSDPSRENLPVILLSAKVFEIDEAELHTQLWISHIVPKPFSPRALLQLVKKIVGPPDILQDTASRMNVTPVDTTPVDTTPVDTTPVDTTPVDTTPVGAAESREEDVVMVCSANAGD